MEKVIKIDNKDVKFKATAGTPRRYLTKYHRDMLRDLQKLSDQSQSNNGEMNAEMLEVFSRVAYIMAKQADPENVPDDEDEWFDQFEIFSIYQVLPEIFDMWNLQADTQVEAKKNLVEAVGK